MALALSRSPPDTGQRAKVGMEERRWARQGGRSGGESGAGLGGMQGGSDAPAVRGGSSALAWGRAVTGRLQRSVPGEGDAAAGLLSQSLEAAGGAAQIDSR
jgi:hypothetical protein